MPKASEGFARSGCFHAGAYEVLECEDPEVIIVGTGSEASRRVKRYGMTNLTLAKLPEQHTVLLVRAYLQPKFRAENLFSWDMPQQVHICLEAGKSMDAKARLMRTVRKLLDSSVDTVLCSCPA